MFFRQVTLIPALLVLLQGANCVEYLFFPNGGEAVQATPTQLNPQYQTVIIVHGWIENATLPWIPQLAQLYHRVGGYNVLALDWSAEANLDYVAAAAKVKKVGIASATIFAQLLQQANIQDLNKVHFLGHSMGSHVSGAITYVLRKQFNLKIGRLTGLDVAAPLYDFPLPNPSPYQFKKGRTVFTDAIHTSVFFGVILPKGDVDFYVNGAAFQPTCNPLKLSTYDFVYCSHKSSHYYYGDTIVNPTIMIGHKGFLSDIIGGVNHLLNHASSGPETVPMGEYVPWNVTGIYTVKTNASATTIIY